MTETRRATYAERRAQVLELRAEGLTLQQVADRLGLSRNHVGRIANERYYKLQLRRSRDAKRRRTGVCRVCGATTQYAGRGRGVSEFCHRHGPEAAGLALRGRGPTVGRALAFISGGDRRFSEIRDHLGITSEHAGQLLHRLLRYGLVVRVSRGVYRLASPEAAEAVSPTEGTES